MTDRAVNDRAVTGVLETHLRSVRASGSKILAPYLTGGYPGWERMLEAAADAGANAFEVGIPFSDPVMDGPVIQKASEEALSRGTTPLSVLEGISRLDLGVPVAAMTYYNVAFRMGLERFASTAAQCGVSAVILPDLPLDEAGPWLEAAKDAGIETILLGSPTTTDERLVRICEASSGFVYAVGLLGITGTRDQLADSAIEMARRAKAVTDKPVLVGVGVSNPGQARAVCEVADGVAVGSAIVARMMSGDGPEGVGELVSEFRSGLDS